MAKGVGGNYFTVPNLLAGASQASNQFKIMKFASTAGECIVGAASTDSIIGVLQNDPADGEVAEIAVCGVCRCHYVADPTGWIQGGPRRDRARPAEGNR